MAHPAFLSTPLYKAPELTIQRQPQKRGYRFRYHSEGLTHGGIRGEPKPGEKDTLKLYPTLKLKGFRGQAKIVLTIVTADNPTNEQAHLHAHSLIVNKKKTEGYHVFSVDGKDPTLDLSGVAIQHVVREKLTETVMDRILQTQFLQKFGWSNSVKDFDAHQYSNLTAFTNALRDKQENGSFMYRETNKVVPGDEVKQLRSRAEELQKTMDMNKCRFCFQAFLKGEDGHFSKMLDPVYSDVIYDGKTKHGAALKITRISKVTSSVSGDEEVWLIADKLSADDLEVRFYEDDKPGQFPRGWEDFGKFQKTDVLKQICLIFRTPKYHDESIEQPVSVNLQLRRKSDPECVSEPHQFKYTPVVDRYGIGEKRKKEIPMDEILNFQQSVVAKRTYQPSNNYHSNHNNNNTMAPFNFPSNMNYLNMMNPGTMLNSFANQPVTSSTLNMTSSPGMQFGNNFMNMNNNTTAVSMTSSNIINNNIVTRPPVVSATNVNHGIMSCSANGLPTRGSVLTSTTKSETSTVETSVKEETDTKRKMSDEVMDSDDSQTSMPAAMSGSNLAAFTGFPGQSESLVNFIANINYTPDS